MSIWATVREVERDWGVEVLRYPVATREQVDLRVERVLGTLRRQGVTGYSVASLEDVGDAFWGLTQIAMRREEVLFETRTVLHEAEEAGDPEWVEMMRDVMTERKVAARNAQDQADSCAFIMDVHGFEMRRDGSVTYRGNWGWLTHREVISEPWGMLRGVAVNGTWRRSVLQVYRQGFDGLLPGGEPQVLDCLLRGYRRVDGWGVIGTYHFGLPGPPQEE